MAHEASEQHLLFWRDLNPAFLGRENVPVLLWRDGLLALRDEAVQIFEQSIFGQLSMRYHEVDKADETRDLVNAASLEGSFRHLTFQQATFNRVRHGVSNRAVLTHGYGLVAMTCFVVLTLYTIFILVSYRDQLDTANMGRSMCPWQNSIWEFHIC